MIYTKYILVNHHVDGSNISMVRLSHRRNGLRSIPIFLCRKISHMLRHSSSFAKRHTRLACSLVNALSDGSLPLPPFCASAPSAQISLWLALPRRNKLCIACSDFSIQKCAVSLTTFLCVFLRLNVCF